MADDIMPEEAARRRRAGELRRLAMRNPVAQPSVDEAIERQRAASRELMRRAMLAEQPYGRARMDMPRVNAAELSGVARGTLPSALAATTIAGRRSLRDAALAPFEEEGRIALEEARAARAINRAARGRAMPGVGEGGTLQDLMMSPPDEMTAATSRLRGTRTRNQDPEGTEEVADLSRLRGTGRRNQDPEGTEEASDFSRLRGSRRRSQDPEGTDEAADFSRLRGTGRRSQDAEGTDEAADFSRPIRGGGIGEGGTLQPTRQSASASQAATTDEMRALLDQRAADRDRARNRPNTRGRPREAAPADRDSLEQIALGAVLSDMMKGGDIQPAEEQSSLDRALGRIGLRRTNETGEGRPSTGNIREDFRALGRTLGLKKGGKVKKMASGGVVKSSASRRGDGIAARGKTKGRMV